MGNKSHSYAITSLVLGIISIICVFFGVLIIAGIICGIIAIVYAKKSKKDVYKKESIATVGFVCGIIGTIISVIGTIFYIIVFIISFKSVQDLFERSKDKSSEILERNQIITSETLNKENEEYYDSTTSITQSIMEETQKNIEN